MALGLIYINWQPQIHGDREDHPLRFGGLAALLVLYFVIAFLFTALFFKQVSGADLSLPESTFGFGRPLANDPRFNF